MPLLYKWREMYIERGNPTNAAHFGGPNGLKGLEAQHCTDHIRTPPCLLKCLVDCNFFLNRVHGGSWEETGNTLFPGDLVFLVFNNRFDVELFRAGDGVIVPRKRQWPDSGIALVTRGGPSFLAHSVVVAYIAKLVKKNTG